MGQQEILKILKEDEWMKSGDVANKLDQSQCSVASALKKLFKQGLVFRRDYHEFCTWGYEWRLK